MIDVLPTARVVQRLLANLGIELLNDLFKLFLQLYLDVVDSTLVRVEQAPEVPDHLSWMVKLLEHYVFLYAFVEMLTWLLKLEKVLPYPSLVSLYLLLNDRLQVLELLVGLGIYLMDLSNVVNLLESPFEVVGFEDLTLAWNDLQLLNNRAWVQLVDLYWMFYHTVKHIMQVFWDFQDIMLFSYLFESLNQIERCLDEWDILIGTYPIALLIGKAPVCSYIVHEHRSDDCVDFFVNV